MAAALLPDWRTAMPAQLPDAGAVFLDHVAHFVPAMDAAAQALEDCGFRLTRFTAQTNRVDGKTVAAGTGNRCAMLRRGYVEILAATADTPLAQQLNERLVRHVGLHLAAFGSADAAVEHRRLAAAGFPVLPLVDMRRPVMTENGEAEARFSIARIAPGVMAEGRMQFLTHHTPHLVWREPDLDHPNGAQALAAVWIAAADPAEPAERFARFTGRPARRDGAVTTIALERGALRFATAEFLAAEFGIAFGPPLPYLAACEIEVASVGRLLRHLDGAGLARRQFAGGAAVPLPVSAGGTILFRAAAG
jgi:glyoxalase-like protein